MHETTSLYSLEPSPETPQPTALHGRHVASHGANRRNLINQHRSHHTGRQMGFEVSEWFGEHKKKWKAGKKKEGETSIHPSTHPS